MDQFFSRDFTLDRAVRIMLVVGGVLAFTFMLESIWEVLLPFLLAGIFAYVVMPLVRWVQYGLRVRSRALSVLIVFVLLTLIVVSAGLYLVPAIESEITKTLLALRLYSGGDTLVELILPSHMIEYLRKAIDIQVLLENLNPDRITEVLGTIWNQAGGLISSTLSVFSWSVVFAMGIIYFIFILVDFEGLGRGFLDLFPATVRPTVRSIFMELDYYMNSYFRGQALVALSVGVLLSIGFNIIGLPMATALGVFIGILNFIPYMQALGVLPLTMLSLLMAAQTGQNAFVCLLLGFGVLLIVQVIQDTLLVPRIMGRSMGMRPSLILLSLAIWGYLLGFFGMLIALPMTMALYSIYMRYILQDKAYIKLMDERMKEHKPAPSKTKTDEQ